MAPVKITKADGTVEWRKASSFKKPKRRSRYKTYLLSPKWKAKRRSAIKRAGSQCEKCGAGGKLHVHHLTYERFGREKLDDLEVLCQPCHAKLH